jgi:hypothetical protein
MFIHKNTKRLILSKDELVKVKSPDFPKYLSQNKVVDIVMNKGKKDKVIKI